MQPPAHDLASGVIEPLDSTSIHLIQRGITRLMQMFPGAGIRPSDIDEYDEQTWQEIEYIRDFIVLHYHVTNRQDSPFWRACRGMEIPASLKHRIGLFRETGRVPGHQAYVDQYCKAAPAASAPG